MEPSHLPTPRAPRRLGDWLKEGIDIHLSAGWIVAGAFGLLVLLLIALD